MPLYDESCRPWWRKIDFATVRYETALLSDEHKLLYFQFLVAYTEHRCQLSADPGVLARALQTTTPKARNFLKACAGFLSVDADGNVIHASSREDFALAVRQSIRQSNIRKNRVKGAANE